MFWILTPNWIYSLEIFSSVHRLPFHFVGCFSGSLFRMLTFLLPVGVPCCTDIGNNRPGDDLGAAGFFCSVSQELGLGVLKA